MGKIEWAMWANEQAVASSIVVILGGILSWIGMFNKWQIAIYAVSEALLGLLFLSSSIHEGKGKKEKQKKGYTNNPLNFGSTKPAYTATPVRRLYLNCQRFLTPVVQRLGPFGRNYYFRFVFYLGCSIPCGFLLSTLLGGACLCISSIIYLVAAIAGEEWKPCVVAYEASQDNTSTLPEAPDQPPPRLHQVTRSNENLYENADAQ